MEDDKVTTIFMLITLNMIALKTVMMMMIMMMVMLMMMRMRMIMMIFGCSYQKTGMVSRISYRSCAILLIAPP